VQKVELEPPHTVAECAPLVGESGQQVARKPREEREELIAVNDTRVDSLDLRTVPHLMFGPHGSLVKLTLRSNDTNEIYSLNVRRTVPTGIWKIYHEMTRVVPPLLRQIKHSKLEVADQMGKPKDIYTEHIHGEGATLGITLAGKGHAEFGALQILSVKRGSPADLAGLRAGDNVVSVDGVPADDRNVKSLIDPPTGNLGSTCKMAMDRAGKTFYVDVGIARRVCISGFRCDREVDCVTVCRFCSAVGVFACQDDGTASPICHRHPAGCPRLCARGGGTRRATPEAGGRVRPCHHYGQTPY